MHTIMKYIRSTYEPLLFLLHIGYYYAKYELIHRIFLATTVLGFWSTLILFIMTCRTICWIDIEFEILTNSGIIVHILKMIYVNIKSFIALDNDIISILGRNKYSNAVGDMVNSFGYWSMGLLLHTMIINNNIDASTGRIVGPEAMEWLTTFNRRIFNSGNVTQIGEYMMRFINAVQEHFTHNNTPVHDTNNDDIQSALFRNMAPSGAPAPDNYSTLIQLYMNEIQSMTSAIQTHAENNNALNDIHDNPNHEATNLNESVSDSPDSLSSDSEPGDDSDDIVQPTNHQNMDEDRHIDVSNVIAEDVSANEPLSFDQIVCEECAGGERPAEIIDPL